MKTIHILFLACCLFSCKSSSSPKVEKHNLDWLVGDWICTNNEEGKTTYESWEKMNENAYKGIGFTMQDGDTSSKERMDFLYANDTWNLFIIPSPGATTETFYMKEMQKNSFVFRNDTIDFPNEIRYWIEGEQLHAVIANEEFEVPFVFERLGEE